MPRKKFCTIHLAEVVPEIAHWQFGDAVNGQEHVEFALG
jgi:hypothetical protein